MVSWYPPSITKTQVTKAGREIASGNAGEDALAVLELWRASHAYIINTFQANLRKRTRNSNAIVGTRLKRRATIENKLRRFPEMQLSRMHDIAGCRVIFDDIEDLLKFRADFHNARFQHKRRRAKDDPWNYLTQPKSDGYRGVHDVYEYDVRSDSGRAWNGLNIEIQYRTLVQHAWATAVEVAGLLTTHKPKLGQGSQEFIEFFRVASEILARHFESNTAALPDWSYPQLWSRLDELEHGARIIQMFRRVNAKFVHINFRKNNILIFPYVDTSAENESELVIMTFNKVSRAIDKYNTLESEFAGRADVVLVRADSFDNMRVTFRNYFADTSDFVALLDIAR